MTNYYDKLLGAESDLNTAYDIGAHAFWEDVALDQCPLKSPQSREAWATGWTEAMIGMFGEYLELEVDWDVVVEEKGSDQFLDWSARIINKRDNKNGARRTT